MSSSEERQDLRQGGLAMGFVSGDRLAAGTAQAREEQEAPQQQAPPDMRTGRSAKACLRREVPTDHEARGQVQRRQLQRVATELRRDRDPEAEAKHAKHGRIRTQISYLSRMTSDRGGEETVTSTHSGWRGTQVALVSPANHPAQRRARAAELWRRVRKRTRGSARGQAHSLSKTRARVKRRRRDMECHDDRRRRARESNVALQDLEKTTLSTRAARGRESQYT